MVGVVDILFYLLFMNDRQKTKGHVRSNVNDMNVQQAVNIPGPYFSLEKAFEFRWSLFTKEHNTEAQTSLLAKHPVWQGARSDGCIHGLYN